MGQGQTMGEVADYGRRAAAYLAPSDGVAVYATEPGTAHDQWVMSPNHTNRPNHLFHLGHHSLNTLQDKCSIWGMGSRCAYHGCSRCRNCMRG
jgi:hypothetical protein